MKKAEMEARFAAIRKIIEKWDADNRELNFGELCHLELSDDKTLEIYRLAGGEVKPLYGKDHPNP